MKIHQWFASQLKINKIMPVVLAAGAIFTTHALAEENAATDAELEKRVSRIEEQLKEKTATMVLAGDKAVPGAELTKRMNILEEQLEKTRILPESWTDRISLSGLIEVDASYEKMDFKDPAVEDKASSGFSLAAVELGVDVKIVKYVNGHVLFLYEDGENLLVDEGYILLDGEDLLPAYLKAGEMYVPFGKFESFMISDPLTLELGETRETAVDIGAKYAGFYGAAYAFNGEIAKDGGGNHIDNFGVSAGYAVEKEPFSLDIGVGWINNIADSDGYGDVVAVLNETADALGVAFALRDYVPGIDAHAICSFGPVTLIGEYVALLEKPEWNVTDVVPGSMAAAGLNSVETGERIATWNVELGYTCSLVGKETIFAVGI